MQRAESGGLKDMVEKRLALDPQTAISRIVDFIRTSFKSSRCAGIVVGLSGGIDSALTATLCVKAVGPEKVTGVFMFEERMQHGIDARHAREIANNLHIRTVDLTLDPLIKRFSETFPVKIEHQVARGNLKARMRMMSLYYLANAKNLLVALKARPEDTAKNLGIDERKVRDILSRFQNSAHKRSYPPMIGSW